MLARVLSENADDVVLVVCQPDRPQGRGRRVGPPAVKTVAEAHRLEITQPTRLKDGVLAARLAALEIDLGVVVAYGRILPPAVFEAPAFQTWNVHASVLPHLRGAAPIQHAILRGDPETGVTLMRLSEGMDEGDALLIRRIPLDGRETGGTLTHRLAALGAEALVEGLALAKAGGLPVVPQNHPAATYAPRIQKADGVLDFRQPAETLERRIRAFSPWPGTTASSPGQSPLKILAAHATAAAPITEPGCIAALDPLTVQTGAGQLVLTQLQPPGKRPMDAAAFLRGAGRSLRIGEALRSR